MEDHHGDGSASSRANGNDNGASQVDHSGINPQEQQTVELDDDDDATTMTQRLYEFVGRQDWEAVTVLVRSHPELVMAPYQRHGVKLLHWLSSMGGTPATLLDLVTSLHPEALRIPDTYLGDTALHLVARHCQMNADKLLSLLRYCPPDILLVRNRLGGTVLHSAANHNAVLAALQALIQHNPAILPMTTNEGIHAVTALWLAYTTTIPGSMTVARILKSLLQEPPPDGDATTLNNQNTENPVWDRFWAKVEYLASQYYWSKQPLPQSRQLLEPDTTYVLHGLLQCNVPLHLFLTCLGHAPHTARAVDCGTGHLPLHVLVTNRPYRLKERDAIVMCARVAPQAAVTASLCGELPLHLALRHKIPWHKGVDVLVETAPQTVGSRDCATRLLPFQLAASEGGRPAVETAFRLLRRQPDLLTLDEA